MSVRAAWVGVALVWAACGGTTPSEPVQPAILDLVVSDDPATKVALDTDMLARFAHHKTFGPAYFHGRLEVDLELAISRDGREWVSLGPPAEIALELQREEVSFALPGPIEVPAGTYPYLRLEADLGVARLEPGAEIGGETLEGPAALGLGEGGSLLVETRLPSPVFAAAGTRSTVALELNAEGWMSEENVAAGWIPATDVETALSVTSRPVLPAAMVPPPPGKA